MRSTVEARAAAPGSASSAGRPASVHAASCRAVVLQVLALIGATAVTPTLYAQRTTPPGVERPSVASLTAGGEEERYLRLMQLAGAAKPYPWSLRGLSPSEVGRLEASDSAHPWSAHVAFGVGRTGAVRMHPLPVSLQTWYNSAFPYGGNDGAVWVGRGATVAAGAGMAVYGRHWSATLAPVVFWAENRAFDLASTGVEGVGAFRDPDSPGTIDLPQRFGGGSYARLDPGQSTLRLDLPWLSLGVSTANQYWGPAQHHPLLLGNNAAGFPHLFLGTAAPVNVGFGHVHARMSWGTLDQSAYSPMIGPGERRFTAGAVAVLIPRGLSGLELGAARFFHTAWPEDGLTLSDFLKPYEGLLKSGVAGGVDNPDNQLASVFFRWAAPTAGFEVYGEYAREDHSWDLRDFVLEPDHNSGYVLGFQRLWSASASRWVALRGEILNTRVSHLARVRPQAPFYVHTYRLQGHTQRGQLLGSPAGYGGAAGVVGVDVLDASGRWSLAWQRQRRRPAPPLGEPRPADVLQALTLERLHLRNPLRWKASFGSVVDLNRDYAGDVFNLNAELSVQWTP